MTKDESGALGAGIIILLVFAYGLKANRGWKYWIFSMLFIPPAGAAIGYALGKPLSMPEIKVTTQAKATEEKED